MLEILAPQTPRHSPDSGITQLKAQGHPRTCYESKKQAEGSDGKDRFLLEVTSLGGWGFVRGGLCGAGRDPPPPPTA